MADSVRELKSLKKLGNPEVDLEITNDIKALGISAEADGTWSVADPNNNLALSDNDRVVVEWTEKEGAKTTTFRAINGSYKKTDKKIAGLLRTEYAVNIAGKLDIKDPAAASAAATIAIVAGNRVDPHPAGDWVIQQQKETDSAIDVQAIINWVKGQEPSAGNLALPKTSGTPGAPAATYKVLIKKLSINVTQGLYTLKLQSEANSTLQLGAFIIKDVGFFISNDPQAIKEEFPAKAATK